MGFQLLVIGGNLGVMGGGFYLLITCEYSCDWQEDGALQTPVVSP